MRALYKAVKQELNRIDFNAIWPGWVKPVPFALVGKDQVYLDTGEAPLGNTFWSNTVTNYEGNLIATWCVDKPDEEDTELLASNLVHEMFHAYQEQNWKASGANELALLSYPDSLTAYRIKAAEANLLHRAYTDSDPNALVNFISLRKSRAQIIGDIIMEELLVEDNEGTAEFAGLCGLMQLSPKKFEMQINQHLQVLKHPGGMLFNVRHMSYSTGAVLCLTLKKLGIDFYHLLGSGQPLFEVISGEDSTADAFDKYYTAKKARFDDYLATAKDTIKKNAAITGFDPMNMWRIGDRILCTRFVGLEGEGIPGPVILNMVPGSVNQVESVILP